MKARIITERHMKSWTKEDYIKYIETDCKDVAIDTKQLRKNGVSQVVTKDPNNDDYCITVVRIED